MEASRILGDTFYHPEMKGLDWEAVSKKYHDRAKRARTPGEFAHVATRFIGELNASHLGIYPPGEDIPVRQSIGYLGIDTEREGDAYVVDHVVPRGPAASGEMALNEGDRITGDRPGTASARATRSNRRSRARTGEEVIVTIEREIEGETKELHSLITTTSRGRSQPPALRVVAGTQRRARRRVVGRARRVPAHPRDGDQRRCYEFERDLYAAGHGKDGLLVDVRNNGGGWTADRVMASLTAQPHAYTVPRGADPDYTEGYPRGRLFIQRWTKPVNMLCNEKSFSNAEIVSHAFKTLDRGTLVGQETWGGVISTGGTALLDGTFVRLPVPRVVRARRDRHGEQRRRPGHHRRADARGRGEQPRPAAQGGRRGHHEAIRLRYFGSGVRHSPWRARRGIGGGSLERSPMRIRTLFSIGLVVSLGASALGQGLVRPSSAMLQAPGRERVAHHLRVRQRSSGSSRARGAWRPRSPRPTGRRTSPEILARREAHRLRRQL